MAFDVLLAPRSQRHARCIAPVIQLLGLPVVITFIVICCGFIAVLLLPILGLTNVSLFSFPTRQERRSPSAVWRPTMPFEPGGTGSGSAQMLVDVIDPVTHLPARGRVILIRREQVVVLLPSHGRTVVVDKKNVAPAA